MKSMGWNSFKLESHVTTSASAASVWSVLINVRLWPEWAKVCVSSEIGEDFEWRSGRRLKFKLRMAGVPVPFDVALTEYIPEQRVAWASTEFSVSAVRTISLAPVRRGLVISDHKAFHSPFLPIGLAYPRFLVRRMTESWLNDLAAEAERRGDG